MAGPNTTSIPNGSLVLVTGVNGFSASHIAKEFLERGYRVRGSVRDLSKGAFLTEELFADYVKRGDFELTVVPDLGAPGAFDDAVRGVAAIAHVASPNNVDPDPHKVVLPAINAAVELLRAAAREPSVKQFVYTSSLGASFTSDFGKGVPTHLTKDMWNESSVKQAWAPPPYEPTRGFYTYLASKTEAEQAVWKFVKEEKPAFDVNTVSPFSILGAPLHKSHHSGTGGWIHDLYNGKVGMLVMSPEQCYINVRDIAVIHVAAALDPEVKGERLLASSNRPFTAKDILSTLRRLFPDAQIDVELPDQLLCQITVDNESALSLVKKWTDREDWISWEETVRDGVGPL